MGFDTHALNIHRLAIAFDHGDLGDGPTPQPTVSSVPKSTEYLFVLLFFIFTREQ